MNNKYDLIKKISVATAVTMRIAAVFLLISILKLGFIPEEVIFGLAIAMMAVCTVMLYLAFNKKTGSVLKSAQSVLCVLLSVCMLFGCSGISSTQRKLERMFESMSEISALNMQVYTLSDSGNENLADLVGKTMGIQNKYDVEHQEAAIRDINDQVLINGEIKTSEFDSIYDMVKALYDKQVDAILLTDDYANILAENEEFKDFGTKTKSVYTVTQEIVDKHVRDAVSSMANIPFVIAIARNDTFPYDNIKNNTGRTDVNILMTVNPLVKKILLVTITRDSYVPINGELDKMDRLTNSSSLGVDAWKNAIEYMMGVDINYFMRINFTAFTNLIDYFGGTISFYNPDEFECRNDLMDGKSPGYFHVDARDITLDSKHALAYARERYPFPDGDFTRNRHDAIILETLIKMISSKENLGRIDEFLAAVDGTFVTDVTMNDINQLVKMQLRDNAEWKFETYGVTGEVTMDHSYTGGAGQGSDRMYVVYPNQDMINTAREKIESLLAER